MINEIQLENYRGFSKHNIPVRDVSIVVGRNNAGKTTIIEALTLLSIVASRISRSRFIPPPEWSTLPNRIRGITPSLRGIDFEFRNLCFRYGEPPAVIRAKYEGNKSVEIHVNSDREELFACFKKGNRWVTNKKAAEALEIDEINVLPPIGRLRMREEMRNENYVRENLNTRLASLHFRNQIFYLGNEYDETGKSSQDDYGHESYIPSFYASFVALAESSWPHLRINSIDPSDSTPPDLNLLVRDGSFVAEVGWVGSGLQAWLQTCWFLARCPRRSIVVLDEPDVFLHPDLQRRLFRLVQGHFLQVIIATHSTEMLAEVNPENVLVVDKDAENSRFAENIPAVQNLINNIGGAHNLQFTRLWSARKCVFVEGNDLEFLSAFHEAMFPDLLVNLNALPHISINGYGNWKMAVGAAFGLRNAGDQSIKAYCILDSDFRTEDDHQKVRDEAERNGVNLHIWMRKEIENYVICAPAISRIIERRSQSDFPTAIEVEDKIASTCDEMKTVVFDSYSDQISFRERKGAANANKQARKIINEAWKNYEGKVSICSGKTVISAMSGWAQDAYGVSFSALTICREMRLSEIPPEIIKIVAALEEGADF